MGGPDCCQVIDGDGRFHDAELDAFVGSAGVRQAGQQYQVVAIMGPQSSGKSTLMNAVFGTTFAEMDAMSGRQQTTKGVWLARSPKIEELCTLVLDLEGSDGRERGEDDTNFERQSALFALAVADALLINVWCHDIGREQGSGKPLMKTIFQVNLKLFAPEPNRRRTVLLFVIRDKSKTPLPKLVEVLSEDVTKMWDSISKPPQYVDSRIEDFFEVQYTALPHYEDKYEDFMADTVVLRRRFTPEGEGSLVRVSSDQLPADSLVLSTQNIWDIIRSQKDLNLPAHKVMVANIRCNELKADQLRSLEADQAWQALAEGASSGLIRDFGAQVAALLDSCIKGYEVEAAYFDARVRAEHGADLAAKLKDAVAPAFGAQCRLLVAQQLAAFDRDFKLAALEKPTAFSAAAESVAQAALTVFDKAAAELLVAGTELSADGARAQLGKQIAEHVAAAKASRLEAALSATELTLNKLIAVPAVELLATFPHNLWQQLAAVRKQAAASARQELSAALVGVQLSAAEQASLSSKLEGLASKKVADLLQEAALTRVSRMRDVFNASFTLDEHGTPRRWMPRDNIPQLARAARRAAARVLALLAVIRGGDYTGGDAVESAIMAMVRKDIDDAAAAAAAATSSGAAAGAGGRVNSSSSSSSLPAGGDGGRAAGAPAGFELATASQWPGVGAGDVLIAPHEARTAWREFMAASALTVQQAQVTQQANLMAGKRSAPVWALAAILLLGWNELMAVLWNPVYLLLGGLLIAFGWQLYSALDVDAEMQRGPLMGLLNIWGKLGDTARTVVAGNVELARNLGGAVLDSARGEGGSGHLQPALAGGGSASGALRHASGEGLKQRGAGARAQQQASDDQQHEVQMADLSGGAGKDD